MANNHTFLEPGTNFYQYRGDLVSENYLVNTNYVLYDDGVTNYRKGVRNGIFVLDVELYPMGFADPENVGWNNMWSLSNN
jgi:hypothetical protein